MAHARRFLVVTLDAAGNWPPERVLIGALVRRGHRVRVVSGASQAADIAAAGAEYRPYLRAPERDPSTRHDDPPGGEMARVLRDVFLNPVYAEELLAQLESAAPDVLLVDQMLLMAIAAAERTGLPRAVLWHTVYAAMASRVLGTADPMLAPLNALRGGLGLAPVPDRWDSMERFGATLAFTWAEFDAAPERPRRNVHYVGPLACLPQAQPPYRLPWPDDDRRPLVLVSYSTSFQDQVATLQRVADAVAELPARVLLTLGKAISAGELRLPGNVVAETFVPHAAVLPHASLVVTHAGHGTVMAAVTAGVPLVCTPMGRDQHVVGACVERCGLGVIEPMTAPPEKLRETIAAALADDALRERSRRFAAGLDVEAGLRRAVEVLEALDRPTTTPGR